MNLERRKPEYDLVGVIYEDNNDGAALCFSEGGTAMECGEENVVCSIPFDFLSCFYSFVISSGVLVVSWRLFWLAFFSSCLMLFLFYFVSFPCGTILVFRMLMHDCSSLPSRQS